MQLNFLQEDPISTLQEPKRASTTKERYKVAPSDDLFGGLPLVAPPKKADGAFKTISETATILDVPQHVLRFWESRFSQIKPLKMGGGRRYYRPEDIDILSKIQNLLYKQGYTIKGAKKAFGIKNVKPTENTNITTPSNAIILTDKQKKQISAIRQELMNLRETLRPYLAVSY